MSNPEIVQGHHILRHALRRFEVFPSVNTAEVRNSVDTTSRSWGMQELHIC